MLIAHGLDHFSDTINLTEKSSKGEKSYVQIHSVSNIRVPNTRVSFGPVLNAYVVMTSSLLHKDTQNFGQNKGFPSTEPFSRNPYIGD